MKTMFGVLAALLFVTTLALGQQSELPFPQGANPALQNGAYAPAVAEQGNLPASMAANQSFQASFLERRPAVADTPLPFPMAADPSPNKNVGTSPSSEREFDSGLPFPLAANPSLMNR